MTECESFEEDDAYDLENSVLLNLAKKHQVKHIRNLHKLNEIWEEIMEKYNHATGQSYTKKQLQKRLANTSQKQLKLQQNRRSSDDKSQEVPDLEKNDIAFEQFCIRVEIAKEKAELKRFSVEELRLKKEELLIQTAFSKLKEAENRVKIAEIEYLLFLKLHGLVAIFT